MFRPVPDQNLDFKQPEPGQPSKGGRPAFDAVLMFKVLILQKFHALADDPCEYQINDRHSFQCFPGLEREGRIPDAKTIWRFRERPGREGIEALFAAFDGFLREQDLLGPPGKIIDASFVDVPRQHNTRSENQQIKDGQTPEGWEKNLPSTARKTPEPGTLKRTESAITALKTKADPATKLIETWTVTDTSAHDSQALPDLISAEAGADTVLHAGSACRSAAIELVLDQHGIERQAHDRPGATLP